MEHIPQQQLPRDLYHNVVLIRFYHYVFIELINILNLQRIKSWIGKHDLFPCYTLKYFKRICPRF